MYMYVDDREQGFHECVRETSDILHRCLWGGGGREERCKQRMKMKSLKPISSNRWGGRVMERGLSGFNCRRNGTELERCIVHSSACLKDGKTFLRLETIKYTLMKKHLRTIHLFHIQVKTHVYLMSEKNKETKII